MTDNDVNKDASDKEIGERGGMGNPEELTMNVHKDAEDPEEGSPTPPTKPDTGSEKPEEEKDKDEAGAVSRTTRPESDDVEPDEDPAKPEDGEAGKEGKDDKDKEKSERKNDTRTVPYSKYKEERDKAAALEAELETRRELRESIDGLTQFLAKQKAEDEGKTGEEKKDEILEESEKLAKELGLTDDNIGSEGLAKILKKAVDLTEKKFGNMLPADVKQKLDDLDALKKKDEAAEQSAKDKAEFDKEWNDEKFQSSIKKVYPNATSAMLDEARKEMDKLAHSKDFHTYTLEDILSSPRNKKTFDTLLKVAPTNKSGETAKTIGKEKSYESTDREEMTDIENLTPDIMKDRRQRELDESDSNPKDFEVFEPIEDR